MRRGIPYLALSAALLAGPVSGAPERARVIGVDFIGLIEFPTGFMVDGTEVGGLSAIAPGAVEGSYVALADDQGDRDDGVPPRWYHLTIDLGDGSLDDGDVVFTGVTTLLGATMQPYAPNSIDPEGLALTPDGAYYLSSEGNANDLIPPFVDRFGADGARLASLPVADRYTPTADQSSGIRHNAAFEALTATADGRWLFAGMEGALYQDGPAPTLDEGALGRIIKYDLGTGMAAAEVVYEIEPISDEPIPADQFAVNGLVELLAIDNSGTLLALERSFSVGVGNDVRLYEVRTHGALDVLGEFDLFNEELDAPFEIDPPVVKRELLDFGDIELTPGVFLVPDNLEGLVLGPVLPDGRQSLIVVSDNNFSDGQTTQFIALALDLEELPSAMADIETPRTLDAEDPPADTLAGDSDDPAIWVHPSDPSQSRVIASLKDGGLVVFDLSGGVQQAIVPDEFGSIRYNNVDVTYGFHRNGQMVDLAVASDRENDTLGIFAIDSVTGDLTEVTSPNIPQTIFGFDDGTQTAYGLCTYRSPYTGHHYVFTSRRDGNAVAQLELFDDGQGVNARVVRTIEVPIPEGGEVDDAQIEGLVTDNQTAMLYIGEEKLGLWRTPAEPHTNGVLTQLDTLIPEGGNLEEDVEGVTLYYGGDGAGYLIVSSQGDNRYALYDRQNGNPYLGSFVIGANNEVDSVEETDGLDVTNVPLGEDFPFGLLVVQDGANDPQSAVPDDEELENNSTNFKFVAWDTVADAFEAPLLVDPDSDDPRAPAIAEIPGGEDAQRLYLAYLGRPGEPDGLTYWGDRFEDGEGADRLAPAFGEAPEYDSYFDLDDFASLITDLYWQLFDRAPDSAGMDYYMQRLQSRGLTPSNLPLVMLDGAQNEDLDVIDNKLAVSDYFSARLQAGEDYGDAQAVRDIMASVDASMENAATAKAALDAHLDATAERTLRIATFNTSLNRFNAGDLREELRTPDSTQIQRVAEIIQRADPDVLVLQEFDYDVTGESLELFQQNYLEVSQNGAPPVEYVAGLQVPSNTGVPTGLDLDNDGATDGPGDAQGFGFFEGQFAFAILSKYPLDEDAIRSFQDFLWRDMPDAKLPDDPATPEEQDWYSAEELDILRLSSKSHIDIPVQLPNRTVHVLIAHPTPPVFDGEEDRNGLRNHDEIRLWADYTRPGAGDYLYDDDDVTGGLDSDASFVIMGDMNADPIDGDSTDEAILQFFDHPRINSAVTTGVLAPGSDGGAEAAVEQGGANDDHQGDPSQDTGDFFDENPGNLRVDYVLPSWDLTLLDSGVFWPTRGDPLSYLVNDGASSDHRLVWVDLVLE